jgi:LmbE family N-acetylglucosaminyl deacetylase
MDVIAGKGEWEVRAEFQNFSFLAYDFRACSDEFEFGETRGQIRSALEAERDKFSPGIVFSHSIHDSNQDHAALAKEVRRVFKKTADVIDFVFPWNHDTVWPNFFIQLELWDIEKKTHALECYKSQYRPGHPYMDHDLQRSWAECWGSIQDWGLAEAFIYQRGFYV